MPDDATIKKGILFVDDEPNILTAIRRMLRSLRQDFEFYFAENGKEALVTMESNPIDIIVSDMRMPGMDGAQLLLEVQQRFPQSIRIMLTGQADEESTLRTVNIVHQFLSKPCEPEKLKDVLYRSAALHNLVTDSRLKSVVSGIGTLPSLPSVYKQLQDVLANPDAVLDDVAAVIEQDVAMTAKLLQLVNSSFFGLYQKVDSPARAVKLLGLDTIKILALGVQIFAETKVQPLSGLTMEFLWKHSLSVANSSKQIAIQATDDPGLVNSCFIAGMLHDVGRLLFLSKMSKEFGPVVQSALAKNTSLTQEEAAILHATHADVGAYLIGLWGFQGDIIEAIAFHHNLDNYPGTIFNAALAVHIADFCYYSHFPDEAIGAAPTLNTAYFYNNGWTEETLEKWVAAGKKSIETADQ